MGWAELSRKEKYALVLALALAALDWPSEVFSLKLFHVHDRPWFAFALRFVRSPSYLLITANGSARHQSSSEHGLCRCRWSKRSTRCVPRNLRLRRKNSAKNHACFHYHHPCLGRFQWRPEARNQRRNQAQEPPRPPAQQLSLPDPDTRYRTTSSPYFDQNRPY